MSRIKADFFLLITAIIWGIAFVFQKTAMDNIGPFTFVAARFGLSALVVFPLAYREIKKQDKAVIYKNRGWILSLGGVFIAGVVLQQLGMRLTTVTNAGFLTGLYAIFTPILSWIFFRHRPLAVVWISASLSILGLWLLGDASFSTFNTGDVLVIGCACFFALHTVLISHVVKKLRSPLFLAFCQYTICAAISLAIALSSEYMALPGLKASIPAILYAGLLSGGVAYTLQFVAQQYTPASDAGIILSSESLFAALAGIACMGDKLSPIGWMGCGIIILAILLIEIAPLISKTRLVP